MTKQITLEELLELVTVEQAYDGGWRIVHVKGDILSHVYGHIYGDVTRSIHGTVHRDVGGNVYGKINGREWQFVETPKDKLKRLIEESGNEELLEAFNQLENN
jgi:hypothetical protein